MAHKTQNLFDAEFKLQDSLLLQNMTVCQALSKLRVKMAPFGNFLKKDRKLLFAPFVEGKLDMFKDEFHNKHKGLQRDI